ncbi:MAG: 6-pyruvoyl tetrahydropterin synthase family protein [Promethearchaeota archaeon]
MTNQVSVEVSGIGFSAGHFVSEGGKCEQLHGHNYQVGARLTGEVGSQGMVIDFRIIKQHLRKFCKAWDHRVLLPAHSEQIHISTKGSQTQVTTPSGTYSFPTNDVLILDVVETTAEELARLLCQQLKDDLQHDFPNIREITIWVAESVSSRALVTLTL